MTVLRRLSEVKRADDGFVAGWSAAPPDVALVNRRFGRIDHVVVCHADGRPKYDQPLWTERIGAICIPVDPQGRIALVRQLRPVLSPPGAVFEPDRNRLDSLGQPSWELPRGFPEPDETPEQAAIRETYEETGLKAVQAHILDYINTNTTFYPNSQAVVIVRVLNPAVEQQRDYQSPEECESIDKVGHLTLGEILEWVRAGAIICGFTKAALLAYLAWLAFNDEAPDLELRKTLKREKRSGH